MTGAQVREARERLSMTQEELAEALGYSSAKKISDIECGRRSLSRPATLLLERLLKEDA